MYHWKQIILAYGEVYLQQQGSNHIHIQIPVQWISLHWLNRQQCKFKINTDNIVLASSWQAIWNYNSVWKAESGIKNTTISLPSATVPSS